MIIFLLLLLLSGLVLSQTMVDNTTETSTSSETTTSTDASTSTTTSTVATTVPAPINNATATTLTATSDCNAAALAGFQRLVVEADGCIVAAGDDETKKCACFDKVSPKVANPLHACTGFRHAVDGLQRTCEAMNCGDRCCGELCSASSLALGALLAAVATIFHI